MRESIGHYRILDRIGAGALGDLYKARDTRVGRTVALRVVAPAIAGDAALLDRFLGDARASAAVSHPNVAALYEVGEDDGIHYLACEFVSGQTLAGLISGQPLNPRRAIDLTVQIADALADAYSCEVVHGDLRPDTVVVNAKGNAKLLDFGLAHWADAAGGRDRGSHQRDIAALGLVLHEMLTGRPAEPGRRPGAIDKHLPRELDDIIRKTQSDSDRQYEASATLAAELRAVAAILEVRAREASETVAPPQPGRSRRGAFVWVAAAIAAGALAWLVWTASSMR
jgi:serine/threonine protein kinase